MSSGIELRRAETSDRRAILALAGLALGWDDDDRHGAFFAWKHEENPFGPSPMWVAVEDDEIVAFRTFLRWEWRRPDGTIVRTVRAVDTATHPEHQGRGLFRLLTTAALEELADERVAFVFNTPNDQSRPGYLKMGWQVVGRPEVYVRPRGLGGLLRLVRAHTAAEKWSEPASFGEPAPDAFADADEIEEAVDDRTETALRTNRSAAYFRWRFGFAPLCYRVVRQGADLREGFAVVRLRRRGRAVEGTVCELVAPQDRRAVGQLLRQIEGADYLLVAGRRSSLGGGLLQLPRQGPLVTWRDVTQHEAPKLDDWSLSLGDLELF